MNLNEVMGSWTVAELQRCNWQFKLSVHLTKKKIMKKMKSLNCWNFIEMRMNLKSFGHVDCTCVWQYATSGAAGVPVRGVALPGSVGAGGSVARDFGEVFGVLYLRGRHLKLRGQSVPGGHAWNNSNLFARSSRLASYLALTQFASSGTFFFLSLKLSRKFETVSVSFIQWSPNDPVVRSAPIPPLPEQAGKWIRWNRPLFFNFLKTNYANELGRLDYWPVWLDVLTSMERQILKSGA